MTRRKTSYKGQAQPPLGSDEQTREAVRISNEESLKDNQGPTDENAAEDVRVSNDEQYDAERNNEP